MRKTTRVSIDLPAEAETVYQALTDESQVKRWLAEHAEISLPFHFFTLRRRIPLSSSRKFVCIRG